jgi:transcriptional regulator with XRE-family HTH domain
MEVLHETLVAEIRDLRNSLGMDQQDLANAVGMSRSAISNIENKRQFVTLVMFYKIALALKKNPGNWLNELIEKDRKIPSLSTQDVGGDHDILQAIQDVIK